MFQSYTRKFLNKHASKGAPLLFVLGLLLIVLVPAVYPKENFIDENAITVYRVPVFTSSNSELLGNAEVPLGTRVVRGRRSVGSEALAVYVNAVSEPSVRLANHLISILRERENMACDTHFYFFNDTQENWPIPDSFVRAALVINVTSFETNSLCFSVFGANGMQPNQDLFNLAVVVAERWGFAIDVLCQNQYTSFSTTRSRYHHYYLALQTALVAPLDYKPWYKMRSHGISVLAVSTGGSAHGTTASHAHNMASAFEQIIATLSYLHERFHHSTSIWIPLSVKTYVEYDVVQFGTISLVASLLSSAYSIYEAEGLNISPCAILICATAVVPILLKQFGTVGFIVSGGVLSGVLAAFALDLSWLAINAVVLCLLIILQPAAGLVLGSGAALQLLFLHVKSRKRDLLLLGTVTSWLVLFFFTEVLKVKLFDTETTAGLYFSFLLYPNALWVSSRFIRCVAGVRGGLVSIK
uniref:Putative GPI transamidase component GAA1 n=1 Tax=Trypanosoma congolense (strain IL3000) TaxID=1068625 RepID=G0UV35_TRYCI|nr:putative GPI transamidase component GAA1 [Trypanosoma congolense IL3000]